MSIDWDSDRFDERELIEVESHHFERVQAKLEPIEPEPIILGMSEPGSGLGLSISKNLSLDRVDP